MRLLFVLLFPSLAFAAKGGSVLSTLFFQVFNFSLFVIILYFLLKKPVQNFFINREARFKEEVIQAQKELDKSLSENTLWKNRLKDLKNQARSIEEKAQKQGELYKQQKESELSLWSQKKQKEISFFHGLELKKTKEVIVNKLRKQLVTEARLYFEKGSSNLSKEIMESSLKKIQRFL